MSRQSILPLVVAFLIGAAGAVVASRPETKFCGCDVAAPCSDCCSASDCKCSKPIPTAAR